MSKLAIDASRIKAFIFDVDGVLSATTLRIGDDGQPMRTTNLRDGLALRAALRAGYRICIITGGKTDAVELRYHLLGITDVYSGITRKLPVMQQWMLDHGLVPEEVAYMGDDIPDLQPMRHCGLAAAPHDAASEVLATATFISKFTGGYGCARDLIESVMRAQGRWEEVYAIFEAPNR